MAKGYEPKPLDYELSRLQPDKTLIRTYKNALTTHTMDIGVTPTDNSNGICVVIFNGNQGIFSIINYTDTSSIFNFGTGVSVSSVSINNNSLTIEFSGRPWGMTAIMVFYQ